MLVLGMPPWVSSSFATAYGIFDGVGDLGNDFFPILADADDDGVGVGLAEFLGSVGGDRRENRENDG